MRHYPQRRKNMVYSILDRLRRPFFRVSVTLFSGRPGPSRNADRGLGIYSTPAPRRDVSVCMHYCYVFLCGTTSTLYLCVFIFTLRRKEDWPLGGCR